MRSATLAGFVLAFLAADASAQVDLVGTSFDVVQSSATGSGTTLDVDLTVANTGSAASGAFTVRFYYSDNTSVNPASAASNPEIGSATVASIAGGASSDVSAQVTLTGQAVNGTRYVHYWIDPDNEVAETNESNNQSDQVGDPADEDAVTITGQANLVSSFTSVTPSSGPNGTSVTATLRVTNTGQTSTGGQVSRRIYFSDDDAFGSGDVLIDNFNLSRLSAGASDDRTFTFDVPSGLPAGSYFLVTSITAPGTNDSDPSDTQASTPFTVTAGPDLVVTALSIDVTPSNGTVGLGDPFAIGFTVENQGGGAAGPFDVQFFYDDDDRLLTARRGGSSSEPAIATYTVAGGLTAGASLTVLSTDADAPSGTLPGRVRTGSRFVQALADPDPTRINGTGAVSESDETNNTASVPLEITGQPDLIVQEICVVANPEPASTCGPSPPVALGEKIRSYTRIANVGKAYAQSPQGQFYLSADAAIEGSDAEIGSVFGLGSLEAGATVPAPGSVQARTLTLPTQGPTGSAFVGLLVSSPNDAESDTDNNGASDGVEVAGPPNLTLTAFSIATGTTSADGTPSAQGSGSTVTVSYTVANTEPTDADAFAISFYLNNAGNTGTGSLLESVSEAGLAGGASRSGTATLTLPSTAERGLNADGAARGIRYRVDALRQVAETDEDDNEGGAPLDVTGRPDLLWSRACLGGSSNCSDGSYAPPTVVGGTSVSIAGSRAANDGVVRPAGTVDYRIYFSDDATISPDTDEQIGSPLSLRPSAGSSSSTSQSVTIPASAAAGTRYVGFVADPSNALAESDEANNTVVLAIEVQSAVNLSVVSWTATDAVGSGATIEGSLTVRNTGTGAAPASTARLYYDDDGDASGETQLPGACAVPALAGGAEASLTCTAPLPASVLAGSRTLRVRLDQPGDVPESDETDNDADAAFTVTGAPDLLFSAFAVASGDPGEQVAVSYTVRNDGASRVDDAFTTVLYYSADMTVDAGDTPLDTQTRTTDLNAGATFSESFDVTIPGSAVPGGFLIARADDGGVAAESDEANNTIASQAVLPVELVAFDAVAAGEGVVLTWQTASETNNDGFHVQTRPVAQDEPEDADETTAWTDIGWVDGNGTTLEAQAYRFESARLAPGTHRFRLKQVDLDGASAYGPVAETALTLTDAYRMDWAGPNPSSGPTALRLFVREAQPVTAMLYDALGRVVEVLHDGEAEPGRSVDLAVGDRLPAGLYHIHVVGGAFTATRALVRVR